MTQPVELGAIRDPAVQRAFQQVTSHPASSGSGGSAGAIPVVPSLPGTASSGDMVYLAADNGIYVWDSGWQHISQGATGPTGPQGVPGDTGPTGPQGIQGDPGPAGPTGATGATGPPGADSTVPGPQGPTGPAGSIWRSGTGAPSGALGVVGDWYENDANGDIYEKTGTSTYTLRDNLTGPQGPQGNPGAGAPDATTTTKGSIQLAGDLTGTAASPQIAAGAIVDADVNAAAAIAESKLALASDAAAGTASRRTLGTTATSAAAGNRGLPAGGTTGQVLRKTSATDYAVAWQDIPTQTVWPGSP